MKKDTSLIITTYNWPEALKICMESILSQTVLPKEIIIADDGSKEETKILIDDFIQNNTHIKIIHSWQEDNGFRAAMSRNKAIAKSTGKYVIIIDGDLILEKHFIEDHIACREEGYFIQGPRVNTTKAMKDRLLNGESVRFKLLKKGFLDRNRLIRNTLLSLIYSKKHEKLKSIESCNMSFYRKDFIQVNGFDEKFMDWGYEDTELAARFFQIGLLEKRIKHRAIAYHLFHTPRNILQPDKNIDLLTTTIQYKKTRAEDGVDKYLTKVQQVEILD